MPFYPEADEERGEAVEMSELAREEDGSLGRRARDSLEMTAERLETGERVERGEEGARSVVVPRSPRIDVEREGEASGRRSVGGVDLSDVRNRNAST